MVENLKAEMSRPLRGESVEWLGAIPEQDASKAKGLWRKVTFRRQESITDRLQESFDDDTVLRDAIEEALNVKENMMDLAVQKFLQASTEQWHGDIFSAARACSELMQERLLDVPAEIWKIFETLSYKNEPGYNAIEFKKACGTAEDLVSTGCKAQEWEMTTGNPWRGGHGAVPRACWARQATWRCNGIRGGGFSDPPLTSLPRCAVSPAPSGGRFGGRGGLSRKSCRAFRASPAAAAVVVVGGVVGGPRLR